MTAEEAPLSSQEEFNAELKALLRRAYDGGLDVKGGWGCRNGTGYPDWDVMVTKVRKDEETERRGSSEKASSADA